MCGGGYTYKECYITDVVSLLGAVIVFCLRCVGKLSFMPVFIKSTGSEVLVDYWCLICDD